MGVDRESSQRGTHRPVIRITQPDGSVSPTIQAEAISRDSQGRDADHPPWWEWTPPFRTQGIERITPPDMRITLHDGSGAPAIHLQLIEGVIQP